MRYMVVDKDRNPIVGCTGYYTQDGAQAAADDLNENAPHPEFGPFRVVDDVVTWDLEGDA